MRRAVLPLYALLLLETMVWIAIVPLAPTFAERLLLSPVETGALLASASFATVVVAFPAGLLADRLGARAFTIGSAVVFTLSTVGQGLAGDFWTLLVARAAFGIAFGVAWTAGLAWLADSAPPQPRARALGATVAISGLGFTAGPAFAGLLADRFDIGVPFLVIGAVGAVVTAALLLSDPGTSLERTQRPLLGTLRAARRDELVLGGVALLMLLGFVSGGVNLLVPLHLRANGVSAGAIGLVFSAASGLFTVVSAVVARLGERAVSLKTGGVSALLLGLSILLLVASGSTAAAVAFVLLRAPFWAVMDTIVYPLGAAGAHRASLGRGAVMGLINLAWGVAATVGPLAAGALAQSAGERWGYGMLIASCAATGTWMLSRSRTTSAANEPEQPAATIPRRVG